MISLARLEQAVGHIPKTVCNRHALYFPQYGHSSDGIIYCAAKQLYEKRNCIFVYNNTGVLNSANDLLVSSDKYTAFYNIMSVVVNPDGIFMNLPVDDALESNIQPYLDEQMLQLMEDSLHE